MASISDILTHEGEERNLYFNAIAPPIIQTSNFAFPDVDAMRKAMSDELAHHIYTRGNNPTVAILRKKLAALEHTEDALVVGSGAAAVAAAVIANVAAGDHIICVQKPYSWTYKLISSFLPRFGVSFTFVDGTGIHNVENAIRPNTRLLYLESPNSLTFEIQDLKACSELAAKNGLVTIIDNSHASPLFQNPADFGIDIIVHSATKYINGHSDVVAGAICSSHEMIKKIFQCELMTLGLTISPHDAALMLRGLRTLPLRVKQSDTTAALLADWFSNHPGISKVYFPLHPSFPQYELAKSQMKGCGGLVTVMLNAPDKQSVLDVIARIKKFLIAVSWGGYESLMIPSIVFHDIPGVPDSPVHWSTIRFYAGLEEPEELIADLEFALKILL
jgi:cystathionine beta-lyase/cystathionine gamma-synthase